MSCRAKDGLCKKTQVIHHADGFSEPVAYWQASKEVPADQLPAGMTRKRVTGNGPTKKEALSRLEQNYERFLRGESGRGRTRLTGKMTVRRLFEEWDRNNQTGEVSSTQTRAYQGYFNNNILPALGDKRLDSLTETDLSFFFNQTLTARTNTDNEHLLGPSARRNIYMALSGALTFAVRNRYLPANPLKAVKAPRKTKPQEDIDAFLIDAQKVRDYVFSDKCTDQARWALTLLGLRRSERLGLRWGDIQGLDGDNPSLAIRNQLAREKGKGLYIKPATKSGKSRTIRLVEPWVSVMRDFKKQWDELPNNPDWQEPEEQFGALLFLRSDGKPTDHNADNDDWHSLLETVGVPYWRGHLMRHYTAVMLAEQPSGTVTDVMSILGHDTAELQRKHFRHDRHPSSEDKSSQVRRQSNPGQSRSIGCSNGGLK
jgi:integrase